MSGLQIVRETIAGYGQHGQDVLSQEAFVKVLFTFLEDGSLRQLKGAPLSAFLCVALYEAKIVVSGAQPLTVSDIEGHTGWSRRSLIAALDYLVEHNYLAELPERGEKHEKQYRVIAYAYFGSGEKHSQSGHALHAPLHKACGDSPQVPPVVVIPESSHPESIVLKQQQTETRQLFLRARVEEPALSVLARSVLPEVARTWVEWLPNAPASFTDPVAFMVKRLKTDPAATPPGARQKRLWYDGFEEYVKR